MPFLRPCNSSLPSVRSILSNISIYKHKIFKGSGAHIATNGEQTQKVLVPMPSTRILIVDDQESLRKTLSIALRLDGFDVACAASATDALEALSSRPCDLAIVDLMMPGINGLDLARQLRTLFPNLKVVLTSAYHLSERQLLRAQCGAIGFVPKPFQMSELVAFLRAKVAS